MFWFVKNLQLSVKWLVFLCVSRTMFFRFFLISELLFCSTNRYSLYSLCLPVCVFVVAVVINRPAVLSFSVISGPSVFVSGSSGALCKLSSSNDFLFQVKLKSRAAETKTEVVQTEMLMLWILIKNKYRSAEIESNIKMTKLKCNTRTMAFPSLTINILRVRIKHAETLLKLNKAVFVPK